MSLLGFMFTTFAVIAAILTFFYLAVKVFILSETISDLKEKNMTLCTLSKWNISFINDLRMSLYPTTFATYLFIALSGWTNWFTSFIFIVLLASSIYITFVYLDKEVEEDTLQTA